MSSPYVARHLAFGWRSLLVFVALGALLEALHGFKVGLYLDVSNETRRLLWTLAHAHGTLLSLVNIAFALSLAHVGAAGDSRIALASRCLIAATLLLPGGFFLGGLVIYSGDPGLGVIFVPIGAALLLVAIFLTQQGLRSRAGSDPQRHAPDD